MGYYCEYACTTGQVVANYYTGSGYCASACPAGQYAARNSACQLCNSFCACN